jgi:hypothetical protein
MLGNIELGQILKIGNIVPCIVAAANNVSVSELQVKLGKIESIEVKGFESLSAGDLVSNFTSSIIETFGATLEVGLGRFFDSYVVHAMNNILSSVSRNV